MSSCPKVSIVVPIYGVEKYLCQCLDSILVQTLHDIEIILVDDGSKDGCPQIVDDYAAKDSRIVAIHQTNGGYGKAVNHGLDVATGEYIGIVEPDDWIEPDMYEKLYNKAKEINAEVVKGNFYNVVKDNKSPSKKFESLYRENSYFNVKEFPNILTLFASIWSAIYNRKWMLEKNIRMVEDLRPYEDSPFIGAVFAKAKSICLIPDAVYNYRTDATNSSTNAVKPTIVHYLIQKNRVRLSLIENNMYTDDVKERFWQSAYHGAKVFYNKPNNKFRRTYYKKMQEFFKNAFSDSCTFKYLNEKDKKDFIFISNKSYNTYYIRSLLKNFYSVEKKDDYDRVKFLGIKIHIKKQYFYRFIDSIFPKKNNKIVFLSNPDFSDNAKEYYEYIKSHYSNKYDLVWIYTNKNSESNTSIDKKYYLYSFNGKKQLFNSKYIVSTWFHEIPYVNIKKHKYLQLWHGMPLKTLGFLEKGISRRIYKSYKACGERGHFFVSSDIFKTSMIACFRAKPSHVHITGQPKTDCILQARNKEKIAEYLSLGNYDKLILYTPTYKENIRSSKREVSTKFENIFYFADYDERKFYTFLEENNILFVIKPHPFEENFWKKNLNLFNHPNIRLVGDADMKENGFYFYEFFSVTDLMITDFSSIGIDYLISQKPIIWLNSLSGEYSKNRGFILEDNYEWLMAGSKADNFEKLVLTMSDSLTIDSAKAERTKTVSLLHKHKDSSACDRVYKIMSQM